MNEPITHGLTDDEVEQEISELLKDKDVQLAKLEQRLRYRRRQYLYQLRSMRKKGQSLREAGMTPELLKAQFEPEPDEE